MVDFANPQIKEDRTVDRAEKEVVQGAMALT